MTPAEIIAATSVQIGRIGAAFYFRPETVAVGKANGLGGMMFYLEGRGGVLGNTTAASVNAAFGYFNPELVAKLWDSSIAIVDPIIATDLHLECALQTGIDLFGEIDGELLKAFVDAATSIIVKPDGAAMALFSGYRARPVPVGEPAAVAMHLAVVLRELRGDAHLIALAAAGLPARVAHAVKRPNDVDKFGWTEPIEPTDEDREKWNRAEALTNQILEPFYADLDGAVGEGFVAATEAMFAALPT